MQSAGSYASEVKTLMTELYGTGVTLTKFNDILHRAWWYRYEGKKKHDEFLGYVNLIKYDNLKGGVVQSVKLESALTALRKAGATSFDDLLTEAYWRSVVLYEQY